MSEIFIYGHIVITAIAITARYLDGNQNFITKDEFQLKFVELCDKMEA